MICITKDALEKRMGNPVIRFRRALNDFILEKAYKPSYGTCWGKIGSVAELNVLVGIKHYSDDRIIEQSPELDIFRYGEPLNKDHWQEDFAIYLHDLLTRIGFLKPRTKLEEAYFPYINDVLKTLRKYKNNYGPYQKGVKDIVTVDTSGGSSEGKQLKEADAQATTYGNELEQL